MNIVIAGGRGFIGRPLAERLGAGHSVTIWDLPEVDLLDVASFASAIDRLQPDVVVNLAAILGGVRSRNLGEIFEVNVRGNLNLIEQCAARGVRHYVFASSLTVHGCNPPERPCTTNSPFHPQHAYGASKAAAELCLMQYAQTFDMAVVALRPTLILGDTRVRHAPIDFIQTLMDGGRIEIFGDGRHEREWLWIDDAVEGFAKAVDLCAGVGPGYHPLLLGGNRIAMRDLALKCAAFLNKGPETVVTADHREQAFTLTCDDTETRRLLEWSPRWDLDAIVSGLIRIADPREKSRYG